ncbi:AfsR/SARP family transcriptional regulator [Actinomadura sp. KC216]|uniref:AfsR/SARP family transcriptional regulator n=1 Tax=Actinomadura sp. KC216 TaxID=2530370 RepID=UPI001047F3DE|nr:AfsR/SARP family transcriptional regulator [Actinomadura sp. KC216]TDB90336.1 AfsR/SARP family transcriptional regulator [Actinomadura sp. KC216]
MRFLMLGNLEVYDKDGRGIRLSRTKHRQLLGLLLLRANHAVCVDQLVDGMWPVDPPRFARGNIKTYVSALRPVVDQAGALIETVPRGYQLTVRFEYVDVLKFEELFQAAVGPSDRDAAERVDLLQQALGLWRGEALQDLKGDGGPLRYAATRLQEKRIVAMQNLARLYLRLGHHHDAIDRLRMALSWEPLREPLWRLLMFALYRDGRQAEALSAYREFRAILVENIGLEPSGELQALHSMMLSGDVPLTV